MGIPHHCSRLLAAALLGVAAHCALAKEEPHFFVGLGLGQSKLDGACDGVPNCDNKDIAWKVFGGYQFTNYFSLEGGYIDLGKAKVSGSGTNAILGTYSGTVSVDAWGTFLNAVFTLPIHENFGVFGKVGAAYTEATGKVSGTSSVFGSGSFSESDDGIDWTYGLGINLNFKQFTIRAEWERYNGVGGDFDGDVDVIGASLIYRF